MEKEKLETISFRITREQYDKIWDAAKGERKALAAFVRELVMKEVTKDESNI